MVSRFPPDVSLTPRNVLAALRTVQDVNMLRHIFEVPYGMEKKLLQQPASSEEEKGLVNYFLQTHPCASWEWLGGKLLSYCQDENAVRHVKSHIKPDEGMYVETVHSCGSRPGVWKVVVLLIGR